MNYLVCPEDGERVRVVSVRRDYEAKPIVRCPRCSKVFVLAAEGLKPIADPESQ